MDLVAKWQSPRRAAGRSGSSCAIRPFRKNDFAAEVDRCQEVYNAAMNELWGFVKLTEAEFQYLAKRSGPIGHRRSGAAGRDRRPARRLLHHAARH